MHYRIIATLGPVTQDPATWQALLEAGASEFRLNTSHLSLVELHDWLDRLETFFKCMGRAYPVTLDLQGSKWRLGEFPAHDLKENEVLYLALNDYTQSTDFLPVPHADFFQAAPISSPRLLLNDAKIELHCLQTQPQLLIARVVRGGRVEPRKGITFVESAFRHEQFSAKDQAIVENTPARPFIRYAISYVKDAGEMQRYRRLLGDKAYIVAKLERRSALADAFQMPASELWLCRGDLGAELGLPGMAQGVAGFSTQVSSSPLPVILAGQVLEHMTCAPTPTRSEICYLHDALQHGYQGVVLSDETAIGQYPLEAVRAAAMFLS